MLPKTLEISSLRDLGFHQEIPETAQSIEGNAILKANFIRERYGRDCFADDSGLEVDALKGAPGVLSARYAGPERSSDANIEKLLRELGPNPERKARFITVIALWFRDRLHLFTGICKGRITYERIGEAGFGYDPVFQPEGKSLTFAQMNLEEKNLLSHRGHATRELVDFLSKNTH